MSAPSTEDRSRPRGRPLLRKLRDTVCAWLWLAVLITTALTAASYLLPARFDSQDWLFILLSYASFWPRMLAVQFGVLMLLAGLVALVLRARLLAGVAAVAAACLLAPIGWSLRPRPAPPVLEDSIVVMSCNTMIGRADPDLILQRASDCDADLILLQECTPALAAALQHRLGSSFPHMCQAYRDDLFGQAIFSRRPFLEAPQTHPQGQLADWGRRRGIIAPGDPQLRILLNVGGQEVVLQCVHATPPTLPVFYFEQRQLLGWLLAWVQAESRPVIVAGDFNLTPTSPHAAAFRRAGLREANDVVGRGRGVTRPDPAQPGWRPRMRIDQIHASRALDFGSTHVLEGVGSDHLPIAARVGVK